MPTIRTISREPLAPEELEPFRLWAQSRPGFRPHATEHVILEIDGAFHYAKRALTRGELVERWRALGRPQPYTRYRRNGAGHG